MEKLEILVGPIASGKSTYCRQAAEEGAVIVNDDAIVTGIHAGTYGLYNEGLKPLYKAVENTIIQMGLAMGRRVIVDRPNHSRKMRRRYIALGLSMDVPVCIVMMKRESPEVHAARRAKESRGYSYEHWLEAAQLHEALYEAPCKAEGFHEIIYWEFPDARS